MARFQYRVRDGAGGVGAGVLDAESADQAAQLLRRDGRFIVELSPADDDGATRPRAGQGGRIRRADVITFTQQIAVMVDTGVPISEALQCAAEQTPNARFREVIEGVARRVRGGEDLSSSLAQYPQVFPPLLTSLVRASEASGTMGQMLERVAMYLSKEQHTLQKLRGALTYPAIMFTALIAVTAFLLLAVLPKFAAIYQQRGSALPGPTRLLLGLSDAMTTHWHLFAGTGLIGLALLAAAVGTPGGRAVIDRLKLRLPLIGPLYLKLYLTRGCRCMGTMIAAGVPILDMVAITRQVTRNAVFDAFWDDVDERLRRGTQLSEAMFASSLMPRSVCQMVYAAERSGRLAQVMHRIAEHTELEFDEQAKQTTQYIEPAMIALMGLIVGFVAIALLLPIFSLGQVVS